MAKTFLDRVYALDEEARDLYARWAASYDEELAANGYAGPGRCAAALRAAGADPGAPVLDLGCGTGLGGLALRLEGFGTIDGIDLTPEMAERARARGVYRRVDVGDAAAAMAGADHASVAAIGLFSPGHAEPGLIDTVLGALPPGGHFVFTLNDHALAERSYEARIMAWTDAGAAQCLHREHGPHVPGQDLGATVYVLRTR